VGTGREVGEDEVGIPVIVVEVVVGKGLVSSEVGKDEILVEVIVTVVVGV
jgi:hypothetical protein